MNTHSLTWIFASNNGIIYIYHVADSFGNQLWQQNISNLKKILIMDIFQIAETEQFSVSAGDTVSIFKAPPKGQMVT